MCRTNMNPLGDPQVASYRRFTGRDPRDLFRVRFFRGLVATTVAGTNTETASTFGHTATNDVPHNWHGQDYASRRQRIRAVAEAVQL